MYKSVLFHLIFAGSCMVSGMYFIMIGFSEIIVVLILPCL